MFEHKTAENIFAQMLSDVSSLHDKREGSVIYNMLRPVAHEFANVYSDLDSVLNEMDIDTMSLSNLITKAKKERGVYYREAEKSTILAEIKTVDGDISVGDRFFIDDVYFIWNGLQSDDGSEYLLECESPGAIGNIASGNLVYDSKSTVVSSAVIKDIILYGRDAETADELRNRYYESVAAAPFAGNRAAYRELIMGIPGVGGCRCTRRALTDINFYIHVLDTEYKPLTDAELLERINGVILESAPIGQSPEAQTAKKAQLYFVGSITVLNGYEPDTVYSDVKDSLTDYILGLAHEWGASDENVTFRTSEVLQRILSVDGVAGCNVESSIETEEAGTVFSSEFDAGSENGPIGTIKYDFTTDGVPFIDERSFEDITVEQE